MQPSPATTEVFAFSTAILAIPIAVAVICLILAVICFRKREARRLGCGLFVIALLAGGIFAPAMFQDRIIVGPDELSTTTGAWFAPTRHNIAYKDVRQIRITTDTDVKGRKAPAWEIKYLSGRIEVIRLSDLWKLNSARIQGLLESRGISFTN